MFKIWTIWTSVTIANVIYNLCRVSKTRFNLNLEAKQLLSKLPNNIII